MRNEFIQQKLTFVFVHFFARAGADQESGETFIQGGGQRKARREENADGNKDNGDEDKEETQGADEFGRLRHLDQLAALFNRRDIARKLQHLCHRKNRQRRGELAREGGQGGINALAPLACA